MELPKAFTQYTQNILGEEEFNALLKALEEPSPTSIRTNPLKPCNKIPQGTEKVPWCSSGYYLAERPSFTLDPLFHAGCYYVQEAASMFLAQVVKHYVDAPVVALDLCAAPGGKSTLLEDSLPEGSLLVANEVMRQRSQVLAENLTKWGNTYVVVTNNEAIDFQSLENFFDVILTDVPCSGEGMFRKDQGAIDDWSTANVDLCWQRQRSILADIWPCLKPGGLLVYSTCTYNTLENEENVVWIAQELGADVLSVPIEKEWNITSSLYKAELPVYRFLPSRTKSEGLFMCALRKHGEGEDVEIPKRKTKKDKNKKQNAVQPVPRECKEWLLQAQDYIYTWLHDVALAFPVAYQQQYQQLVSTLKLLHAGIELGSVKGRDFIPHHALAISPQRRTDSFSIVELEYDQAIDYLRREAIVLPTTAPRGYVVVTYQNIPLGWVKNLGQRANNLYPNEWRIRIKV